MEKNNTVWKNLVIKVIVISVLALIMLIPLGMVRDTVRDRSHNRREAIRDITKGWGSAKLFSGPWLSYEYAVVNKDKEKKILSADICPDSLKYTVGTTTNVLHRSIYDVPVYTAEVTIKGNFVLDDKLPGVGTAQFMLDLGGLKGIHGNPVFVVAGKELKVKSWKERLVAEIVLDRNAREGDTLPFEISMKVNGSESLFFNSLGSLTEVEMNSDYPDPSFKGDYLPVERDVREDGFTARWLVSQVTMVSPPSVGASIPVDVLEVVGSDSEFTENIAPNLFGVRLVKPVTQYRQTERATKYGLLVIFLVFIAGFVVEIVSRKSINIIQYMVIGASLVLFYSLLLAFSDFLSFGYSYLIATVLTTASLGGYFIGIVKGKWAYLLTALVALSYGTIYILLQMETFAFLAGTLLLFIILCVIMFLTRDLRLDVPRPDGAEVQEGR